ncbi:MAG TPA: CHAT domain-containing protein [Blastocatellia bacterium]|nr:CHAT domain-containing protein [Blastocatellia bacterium]
MAYRVLRIWLSHITTGVLLATLTTVVLAAARSNPAGKQVGEARPILAHAEVALTTQSNNSPLERGVAQHRRLVCGQVDSFPFLIARDQYAEVSAWSAEGDFILTLFGPSGLKLDEISCPRSGDSQQKLLWVADESGSYRVDVRCAEGEGPVLAYTLLLREVRSSTPEDNKRFAVRRLMAEADRLSGEPTAESRRKAIDLYRNALEQFRALNDVKGQADALSSLGEANWSLGEKLKSLEFHKQALVLRQALHDRRGEAESLHNIGSVEDDLGDEKLSLDYFNRALPLRRASGDQRGEAATLNYMGVVHNSIGDRETALDLYAKALSLRRAIKDRRGEASTLNNVAHVYRSIGEEQRALDSFNEALSISRATGNREMEANALNGIADVYALLGDKKHALDLYNRSLRIWRRLGARDWEAVLLNNVGYIYESLGERNLALDYYGKALRIHQAIGARREEAYTLNNYGYLYDKLGNKRRGLQFYFKALDLGRSTMDRNVESLALHNIGVAYGDLGRLQTSFQFLMRALEVVRQTGDQRGQAEALYQLARIELKRENIDLAREKIEAALNIVEALRRRVDVRSLRATYSASVHDYYELYIDLLMQMHRRQPDKGYEALALEVSERSRERGLLDLLAEARVEIRQGAEPALVDRERSIRRLLGGKTNYLTELLNGEHSEDQVKTVESEIEALTADYDAVEAKIRQASPRYAAVTQPRPMTGRAIQDLIVDDDTVLLEYFLGAEHSYLWAVTRESIHAYELPGRAFIDRACLQVYRALTGREAFAAGGSPGRPTARDADSRYSILAARLSRTLLGPVGSGLRGKRLLIIPDGALQFLPFAALPNEAAATSSKAPPEPLLIQHEIVILPSASAVSMIRGEMKGRAPAPKLLAVLADPVFSSDDPRVGRSLGAGSPNSVADERDRSFGSDPTPLALLPPLPGALDAFREAGGPNKIPRLFSTRLEAKYLIALAPENSTLEALDFQASKTTALSAAIGQYRIVHFATHGLLDTEHPTLSGIVLSLVNEEGVPQDGFLRLQDLYDMRLRADLVVLSACQTALGKEISGDGLVGLTRGFFYAGAGRVVASLWRVKETATLELMKRFYDGILGQRKLTPAQALRAAQLSMWRERHWRAPYYWAAFILEGEWN